MAKIPYLSDRIDFKRPRIAYYYLETPDPLYLDEQLTPMVA
jgi:hypothetical protein